MDAEPFRETLRQLASFKVAHGEALEGPAEVGALPTAPSLKGGVVLRKGAQCELGGQSGEGAVVLAIGGGACGTLGDNAWWGGMPVRKLRGSAVPCALVAFVRQERVEPADAEKLVDALRCPPCVEGCMAQVAGGSVRIRISKRAAHSGVGLGDIARSLAAHLRRQFPKAQGIDVVLVAGDAATVRALRGAAQASQEECHALRKRLYAQRGVDLDGANCVGHCGGCKDRDACATVRRMQRARALRAADESEKELCHA